MNDLIDNLADGDLSVIRYEYSRMVMKPLVVRNDLRRCDPLVISVMRDEIDIVSEFLRHYRSSGIRRFAIIDNNSNDGTLDYLCLQPDVDLYSTNAAFTTIRKQAWLSMLIDIYNKKGQWFLHADADEHIVFDGLQAGRNFPDLVTVMDQKDISRVRGCLVDMYAANDLSNQVVHGTYKPLEQIYPCFDSDGYEEYHLPQLIARQGGPRQRIFGATSKRFKPQLTKYPLFRLNSGDVFINPHFVWPYERNFQSDCFLGILHFKFLPNFASKVDKAVTEGNYWEDSLEYRCYQSVLSRKNALSLIGDNTRVYYDPSTLLNCKIIAPITW